MLRTVDGIGRAAKFAETGLLLITAVAEELRVSALTAQVCYPVHFSEAIDMLRPARAKHLRSRMRDSLFLHLYNSALRTNGVEKYILPPVGSLLRRLVELHGVEGWTGEYDKHSIPTDNPMFVEARCRVEAERRMALRAYAHLYLRSGRDKDYERAREYAWDIWRLLTFVLAVG